MGAALDLDLLKYEMASISRVCAFLPTSTAGKRA